MKAENRITLKEMAQRLNRCPKTFRKYVIEYQIPHICLGRNMLFCAVEVEKYLSDLTFAKNISTDQDQSLPERKIRTKHNIKDLNESRNRYASLLDLS